MSRGVLEEIEPATEPITECRAPADESPRMEIPLQTGEDTQARQRKLRPLPLWLRVVVLVVGWVVLLVGVAGLVLPGIQGIVTILFGAAILSVASELAHKWMRQALGRWPKVWNRVEGFRIKIHDKLHRMVHKD